MPWPAAREVSRIETTYNSELGKLLWAWILRADGEVLYRLSHVDGRRERNPWQAVCRLTEAQRRSIAAGQFLAADLLRRLARERGQIPVGDHT